MENQLKENQLKNAGLKVTLPRVKILQLLENAPHRHMTAEDIFKALSESGEDVGLATVYRVLTQFETAGLIIRHHFEGGHSVFEINQGAHHDHIMCVRCGRIEEFVDEVIEARQEAIAKQYGYRITDHSLYLFGFCKECENAK